MDSTGFQAECSKQHRRSIDNRAAGDGPLDHPHLRSLASATALLLVLSACRTTRLPDLTDYAYEDILWTVAWHPGGGRLSAGGNADSVFTYALPEGTVATRTPFAYTVTELAWHPETLYLAVVGQNGPTPALLLDPVSSQRIVPDSISPDGARAVAWSPGGQYVAVGDAAGYLAIFDVEGRLEERVQTDPKAITALSWHPDSKQIATVGSAIALYDRATGATRSFPARTEPTLLLAVAWHPGGERFAVGDYGDRGSGLPQALQLWTAAGTLEKSIEDHRAEIREVAWSPDGRRLATASDGVRLYDVDGTLLAHALPSRYAWGLAWHPDGRSLAASTGGGEMFSLDAALEDAPRRLR